jgi:ribosome-binding factor A
MANETRARRVGDRIAEETARLLLHDVEDPRLSMVSVMGVDVDRELAFATIYVSAIDSAERKDDILSALEGAAGYIRSQLARRIPLRTFPQLRFKYDPTSETATRIDDLLDALRRESKGGEVEDS